MHNDPGSDRQVVVEVLVLSQVLSCMQETKFVIMLKATKPKFSHYIYFPAHNVMIMAH